MSTATLAVTCLECQVVAFLCPQILNTLFLTPAASTTTGSQVCQHLGLPLSETITVHPYTLITCLVITVHLNHTTQVFSRRTVPRLTTVKSQKYEIRHENREIANTFPVSFKMLIFRPFLSTGKDYQIRPPP